MADKKDEKKAEAAPANGKQEGPPKKRGRRIGFILFMIVFVLSFWFIFPTLTLILIGMVPTIVALLTDNDQQKSSTAAVGFMNAAGITPFVIDLWTKGQTMENVFQIITDPSNWLVILGAAAIGKLIVFAVPQAVASLSLTRSEVRLRGLRKNLESLKESWGADVATAKSIDRIGRGE